MIHQIHNEKDFRGPKHYVEGIYLVPGTFTKTVYRIWYKKKWYPQVFYSTQAAISEYNFLKQLQRDRFYGALVILGFILAITIGVLALVWRPQ
jgi:hypothetical protein